jgi:hypothetical protein
VRVPVNGDRRDHLSHPGAVGAKAFQNGPGPAVALSFRERVRAFTAVLARLERGKGSGM